VWKHRETERETERERENFLHRTAVINTCLYQHLFTLRFVCVQTLFYCHLCVSKLDFVHICFLQDFCYQHFFLEILFNQRLFEKTCLLSNTCLTRPMLLLTNVLLLHRIARAQSARQLSVCELATRSHVLRGMYTYIYIYIYYVYMYVCMYVCIYIYIYIYVNSRLCMYIYIYICKFKIINHKCIYICICNCVCLHKYIYIYIHV
jgi:hypothetical protein